MNKNSKEVDVCSNESAQLKPSKHKFISIGIFVPLVFFLVIMSILLFNEYRINILNILESVQQEQLTVKNSQKEKLEMEKKKNYPYENRPPLDQEVPVNIETATLGLG